MGTLMTPVWVSYVSAAATVGLFLVAVLAFLLAYQQLRTVRGQTLVAREAVEAARAQSEAAEKQAQAAEQALKQSKIATMMELDRLWEGEEYARSRALLHTFRTEMEATARGHLPVAARTQDLMKTCSKALYQMRKTDEARYVELMRLPGFFETVGYFVGREFLAADDIYDLYGGGILRLNEIIGMHLELRAQESGMPPGYMENFFTLVGAMEERLP